MMSKLGDHEWQNDEVINLTTPLGFSQTRLPDGALFMSFSRRHEWPVFAIITALTVGAYSLGWAQGWANPMGPRSWHGLVVLFAGIMIINAIKIVVPVRSILINDHKLIFHLLFFTVPFGRKELSRTSVRKIKTVCKGALDSSVEIVSDDTTIKIKDLQPKMAHFLGNLLKEALQPSLHTAADKTNT